MAPRRLKPYCARISLILLCAFASLPSQAVTVTGADFLVSPNVSFPGVLPSQNGDSLVFQGGGPGTQLMRYRVNPDGNLPVNGDVTINVVWDLTRLACIGFCAGGAADWDPRLFLSDGSMMFGYSFGDNNGGQVLESSAADGGSFYFSEHLYGQQTGTGYPDIGSNFILSLSFTLHDDGITAHLRYPNVDRTFTWTTPLARTTSLALVLAMDNDSGERYQLNSLQFPTPATAPEPATFALAGISLIALGFTRRCKQAQ